MAAAGLALVGMLAWGTRWYVRERNAINANVTQYTEGLAAREETLAGSVGVKRKLQEIAGTTLGSTEEEASATLRSVLNQILAYHGLSKASVATRSAVPTRNPAVLSRSQDLRRADFTESIDFNTVTATATGEGSLESALKTLATIQGQRWAHRVEGVSLKPEGKERERVSISIMVTTLVLTDVKPPVRKPGEDAPPVWVPLGGDDEPWREIAARDPFREPPPRTDPPPVAAVAQTEPPAPPPVEPPRPAYEQWRVTGMTETQNAQELWLVCEPTGEWRRLTPGESVLDAQLVRIKGESAWIRIGEGEFVVTLGSTLAERKPGVQ
jgi:hypothetical protein